MRAKAKILTKEELIEFLKENLEIYTETGTARDYYDTYGTITVRLSIAGELISESTDTIYSK